MRHGLDAYKTNAHKGRIQVNELNCPQCGEPTDQLHEGYCEECCNQNQAELDRHNHEYDHWSRLDNERREDLIKRNY